MIFTKKLITAVLTLKIEIQNLATEKRGREGGL